MNIKPEDWIQRAIRTLNLNPQGYYPPEALLELAEKSSRRTGNYFTKMEVIYSLMNYWKAKCEQKEKIPSVAMDCIMAEYNRQKGIEA